MTDPYDHTATDVRRAAALIAHHAKGDAEGMEAVFAEVRADPAPGSSTTRLMFAVLGLFNNLMPALSTPLGLELIASSIMSLAAMEDEPAP